MRVLGGFLFLAFCLLSFRAEAAAGIGTTYGSGTSDEIDTGYTTAPGTTFSIAWWGNQHGMGSTASGGYVLGQTSTAGFTNYELYMNSGTNPNFSVNWSGRGFWGITTSTDVWQHQCITYSASSTANVPVWYLNGVSQSVTTVTPPTGTFTPTTQPLRIGNINFTGFGAITGIMADVAFWNNTILTASECKALSQGYSPLKIRPLALSLYVPLSPISGSIFYADWGPSHVTQTHAGTPLVHQGPALQKCYPDTFDCGR